MLSTAPLGRMVVKSAVVCATFDPLITEIFPGRSDGVKLLTGRTKNWYHELAYNVDAVPYSFGSLCAFRARKKGTVAFLAKMLYPLIGIPPSESKYPSQSVQEVHVLRTHRKNVPVSFGASQRSGMEPPVGSLLRSGYTFVGPGRVRLPVE